MSDHALRALGVAAGLAPHWTDNSNVEQIVRPDVLRAALVALGLPAATPAEIAESQARLDAERARPALPPMIVARAGEPTTLPGVRPAWARIEFEQGGAADLPLRAVHGGAVLPPVARVGYHALSVGGGQATLAVAPRAALRFSDIAPGEKLWGLAAQIYGLRARASDPAGHFGAVADLAESAARAGADALALSPAHALFLADENHFTPYSPSSRLFGNALYADPALVFGDARAAAAASAAEHDLVDWPSVAQSRVAVLRALYAQICDSDDPLAADFDAYCLAGGEALRAHAVFEALHAREFGADFTKWSWRDWAPQWRDHASPDVAAFARANRDEVGFHAFAQWLFDRSMARAQGRARAAGMRIGLISDLAIGLNPGGSQVWSRPQDMLLGLSVGAPPDALAPLGQNWGLTTFSPRALAATGYAPFLATLRAALRNAGGVRIDHVLGLVRLWLSPDGAAPGEGVYLSYPAEELIALIALESQRHGAVVIGEDLGTVPHGLRDRLAAAGIAGLRVMLFERDAQRFYPPDWYADSAVAMTSTHDTATVAGWRAGLDLATRAAVGQLPVGRALADCEAERAHERDMQWRAFREAGAAEGDQPAPDDADAAADAATAFIARTRAGLVLLPLEDALALGPQPNLPGTTDEHPNWRRLYPGEAGSLLEAPAVAARLAQMAALRR